MEEKILLVYYDILQYSKFFIAFYRCFKELLPNYNIVVCQVPEYCHISKASQYVSSWVINNNLDSFRYAFFIDSFYDEHLIKYLKENGVITVLLVHGSYHWRDEIKIFDYSFIHSKSMYRNVCKKAYGDLNNIYYLPLFLDEKQDYFAETIDIKYRAVFLGSLTGGRIDMWKKGKKLFRSNDIYFPRQESEENGKNLYLNQEDVRKLYSQSLGGVSLVRGQDELPLKTFEIPAYDIPVFTDANDYLLEDIFSPAEEIITFSSLTDMVSKIVDVTDNKVYSNFVSKNAKNRVLKEHLIVHRCKKICDVLEMEVSDVI